MDSEEQIFVEEIKEASEAFIDLLLSFGISDLIVNKFVGKWF